MSENQLLLQSLISYLCHEFISPLSALLTAVEVLEDTPLTPEEQVVLLKNPTYTLRKKIEETRSIYGLGGQNLTLAQVEKIIQDSWAHAHGDQPCQIEGFHPELLAAFPMEATQLVCIILLWMIRKTTLGCHIYIQKSPKTLSFQLHGEKLCLSDVEQQFIQAPSNQKILPQIAPLAFLFSSAETLGLHVTTSTAEPNIFAMVLSCA